jgi:hypothetical protein
MRMLTVNGYCRPSTTAPLILRVSTSKLLLSDFLLVAEFCSSASPLASAAYDVRWLSSAVHRPAKRRVQHRMTARRCRSTNVRTSAVDDCTRRGHRPNCHRPGTSCGRPHRCCSRGQEREQGRSRISSLDEPDPARRRHWRGMSTCAGQVECAP